MSSFPISFGIFFLSLGFLHLADSQVCTWTKIQPSSTTYTRSVSAPAEIVMTVVGEIFVDGGRLTWEGANTPVVDLSILRYNAANNNFSEILSAPRGNGISIIGSHNLTFNTSESDINLKVSAISGGCTSNDRSPVVTLDVKYCNLSYFEPSANATNSSDCGYNCERIFKCRSDSSLTFNATCQANATWSEDVAQCSQTTDTSTATSTTMGSTTTTDSTTATTTGSTTTTTTAATATTTTTGSAQVTTDTSTATSVTTRSTTTTKETSETVAVTATATVPTTTSGSTEGMTHKSSQILSLLICSWLMVEMLR